MASAQQLHLHRHRLTDSLDHTHTHRTALATTDDEADRVHEQEEEEDSRCLSILKASEKDSFKCTSDKNESGSRLRECRLKVAISFSLVIESWQPRAPAKALIELTDKPRSQHNARDATRFESVTRHSSRSVPGESSSPNAWLTECYARERHAHTCSRSRRLMPSNERSSSSHQYPTAASHTFALSCSIRLKRHFLLVFCP